MVPSQIFVKNSISAGTFLFRRLVVVRKSVVFINADVGIIPLTIFKNSLITEDEHFLTVEVKVHSC